jgi:DNA replication and repair protein RecF
VAARLRFLDGIAPRFTRTFGSISGDEVSGTLHYVAQDELRQAGAQGVGSIAAVLLRGLERSHGVDRARQSTSVGPHTHDVEFRLDGRSTRAVGSQGQHRALMLAFKMAQIGDAQEKLGDYPILLLDDVSSELDAVRNAYLFDFISEISCQTLLTTTRADLVALTENRSDFHVVNGSIRPEN